MPTTKKKPAAKAPKVNLNFDSRIEMMNVTSLHLNKKNPRTIKRKDFERLKEQIKKYPKMLKIRPVVHDNGKILGGNQRYRAVVELGWKQVPTINIAKLSEQEKKNFILWDNENPGQWDFTELKGWKDLFNIQVPDSLRPHRYSDENAEMPIVPKFDEKYRAVLIVVETEMDFVNLCTTLNLGQAKDYKSTNIKQTQVISYADFMKKIEAWKK